MLRAILIFLFLIQSCWAAIGTPECQQNDAGASATEDTISTTAASYASGNLSWVGVIIGGPCDGPGDPFTSFTLTDTASNTYTRVTGFGTNNTGWLPIDTGVACMSVWYSENITGNASNVITMDDTGDFPTYSGLIACEISGLETSSALDTTATNSASSASSITSGTFSTAQNDEISMGFTVVWTTGNTWTDDTGYSTPTNGTTTSGHGNLQYQIFSSTQSNVTVTGDPSGTAAIAIIVSAWKAVAAGSSLTGGRGFLIF